MMGRFIRTLARFAGQDLRLEYHALLASPGSRLELNPSWIITALAEAKPGAKFVQIGANDGLHDDPIRHHVLARGWRGVLFEADPNHFQRLQENYRDQKHLTLVNAAVGDGTPMTFYYIDPNASNLPGWTRGIGSLIENNVLKHAAEVPAISDHIRRRQIPTITINDALVRCGTESLDLLLTDVEGYDAELIQQIDFSLCRPRCIYYESRHIARPAHDRLLAHLISHGYLVAPGSIDSVAVLPNFAGADS